MDERSCLQRLPRLFPSQLSSRQPSQLVIDDRQKIRGFAYALASSPEYAVEFLGRNSVSGIVDAISSIGTRIHIGILRCHVANINILSMAF